MLQMSSWPGHKHPKIRANQPLANLQCLTLRLRYTSGAIKSIMFVLSKSTTWNLWIWKSRSTGVIRNKQLRPHISSDGGTIHLLSVGAHAASCSVGHIGVSHAGMPWPWWCLVDAEESQVFSYLENQNSEQTSQVSQCVDINLINVIPLSSFGNLVYL